MSLTTRPVPASIRFSDQVLLIPSFEELGIEHEVIGPRVILEANVEIGDWVNRGDELLTAHIHFFEGERSGWKLLDHFLDKPVSVSATLRAPISGFVIKCRSMRASRLSTQPDQHRIVPGLVGTRFCLPMLLAPAGEPPQHRGLDFYGIIGRALEQNWPRLLILNDEGRTVRLSEAADRVGGAKALQQAGTKAAAFERLAIDQFPIKRFDRNDQEMVGQIQAFRSESLVLRDKLLHLVK